MGMARRFRLCIASVKRFDVSRNDVGLRCPIRVRLSHCTECITDAACGWLRPDLPPSMQPAHRHRHRHRCGRLRQAKYDPADTYRRLRTVRAGTTVWTRAAAVQGNARFVCLDAAIAACASMGCCMQPMQCVRRLGACLSIINAVVAPMHRRRTGLVRPARESLRRAVLRRRCADAASVRDRTCGCQ